MYKDISNTCWNCKCKEGIFYHLWWTCDKAKKYWSNIYISNRRFLKGI